MKKYENVNYDIAKQLINYSNNIANLYNELYKLEIENNKDSKEYTDYIGLINYLKEKEDNLYYDIPTQHLNEYLDFFKNIDSLSSENNVEINKTLFIDHKSYITTRILSILENELGNEEYIQDENDENFKIIQFDPSLGQSFGEFLQNIVSDISNNNMPNEQNNKIKDFHDEVSDMSIIFIEQIKENVDDLDLKNDLTRIKYINSFTSPNIEYYYLSRNFDLDLNIINISNYKDLDYIIRQAYNCSIRYIKELLNSENYSNQKELILNLSLLKSYLYFLSDDAIVSLINKIYSSKTKDEKVKTKIVNEMKNILNIESR